MQARVTVLGGGPAGLAVAYFLKKAGRAVQVGTHDELVAKPGLYRELCEVQALI